MSSRFISAILLLFGVRFYAVNGDLTFKSASGDELYIPYVVPSLKHFGLQNISLSDSLAMIAFPPIFEAFCSAIKNNEPFSLPAPPGTALVFPLFLDTTCEGTFGSWAELKYPAALCSLSQTIITVSPPGMCVGIYANAHGGDKFESMYAANPSLHNCSLLEFEASGMEVYDFLLSQVGVFSLNLRTDENVGLETMESGFVQFLFRGILSISAYSVMFRSVQVCLDRFRAKKANNIQSLVLLVNFVLMAAVGTTEAMGANFITDNLPYHIHLGLYLLGTVSRAACDIVVAIVYKRVLVMSKRTQRRTPTRTSQITDTVLVSLSTLLCLFEVVFFTILMKKSGTSYEFLFVTTPLIGLGFQLFALAFLVWHIRKLLFNLQGSILKPTTGRTDSTIERWLNQISFWIKSAVVFAFLSTISRILFYKMVSFRSPGLYLFGALLQKISTIGGGLSQVQSMQLPSSKRLLHWIWPSNPSVAADRKSLSVIKGGSARRPTIS